MTNPSPRIEKGPAALKRLAAASRRAPLADLLPSLADSVALRRVLTDLNRVHGAAARQMAEDLRQAVRRPQGLYSAPVR